MVEDYKDGKLKLTQRNKFSVGEVIEVMNPDGSNELLTVHSIEDEEGKTMESAPHPKQVIWVDVKKELSKGYILRRKEE